MRAPEESDPPAGASHNSESRKFIGGLLVTLGGGLLLFLMGSGDGYVPRGCGTYQLFYILPLMLWFLFKRERTWVLGIVLGGAVTFLLGSICGGQQWAG
jgi:hypothetical protein